MDIFTLIHLFFVHFLYGKIWLQTEQSDFIDGYLSYVDIYSSPGDILLMNYPGIDQFQLNANLYYSVYSINWVSQTFLLRNSGYIKKIRLYCERYGAISSPLILEIRNCLPTDIPGNIIYTGVQNNAIGSLGEYDFIFENPVYLQGGVKYSVVIYTSSGDLNNNYRVYYINSDLYGNGRLCTSSNGGTNWTGTANDLGFKIYNSSANLQIFQPDANSGYDSYVNMNSPNTNYGNSITLSVERRTNRIRRTFLLFDDISGLPKTGIVDSSFLNLYQYAQANNNILTIQLRMVTSNWDENTITWNNQPSFTATFLSSVNTNTNGWKRWLATDYVRGWYNGIYPNYGFLLISSNEGGTNTNYRKSFYSSDYAFDFGLRPYLEVFFRAYVDSGYFISKTFDSDKFGETRWEKIYFNTTIPSGCEMKFQIATNNDNSTWNFIGPDGTPNTYYTLSGQKIWSGHYGERYIKVKVYFKTSSYSTPILHDFSILYFKDYYIDGISGDDSNYGTRSSCFRTIRRGIEFMSGSDGCYVKNGNYEENIKIRNEHSGIDEYWTFFRNFPGDSPVIDAGYGYGFYDSLGVFIEISGFTIVNAECGFYLYQSKSNSIFNNKIYVPDGGYGIIGEGGVNNNIFNNIIRKDISSSYPFEGIWVYEEENTKVYGNDVRNMNDCGLLLENSKNCVFYQNLSVGNMFGIDIISSSTCSLYNNTFDLNNDAGIHLNQLKGTIYTVNNNITNNKYGFGWVDGSGYVVSDYNNVWNNNFGNYLYPTGYAVPQGANDLSQDPIYTPDYHLGAGSPCIDRGVYVGLPFSGSAPDIGAFESAKKCDLPAETIKSSNGVWGDDVRLTNDLSSSYLSWSNASSAFINDSIIGVVFYDLRDGNYEIYLKKSYNRGEDWEVEERISSTGNPSIFPSVSSNNEKIYIFWLEEGNMNQIMFKYGDFNSNYSDNILLTELLGEANGPSVDVSGNKINIFFSDIRDGNYEIINKYSYDGGYTWSTDRRITFTTGNSFFPDVARSHDTLHVTFFDDTYGNNEVFYLRSVDDGISWSPVFRVTDDTSSSIYPAICARNDTVFIFYMDNKNGDYDIYYRLSIDGGENWLQEERFTNFGNNYYPALSWNGDYINVVYRKNNDVYLQYYNGANWSSEIKVSAGNSISEYPEIISKDDSLYVFWFDERDGNPEIYFKKNCADTGSTGIDDRDFKFIKLFQNYPNPFSEKTKIKFLVRGYMKEYATLNIYNITGQIVKRLFSGYVEKKLYEIIWDGKDDTGNILPKGIYFYEIQVGDFKDTKKMVIIK